MSWGRQYTSFPVLHSAPPQTPPLSVTLHRHAPRLTVTHLLSPSHTSSLRHSAPSHTSSLRPMACWSACVNFGSAKGELIKADAKITHLIVAVHFAPDMECHWCFMDFFAVSWKLNHQGSPHLKNCHCVLLLESSWDYFAIKCWVFHYITRKYYTWIFFDLLISAFLCDLFSLRKLGYLSQIIS